MTLWPRRRSCWPCSALSGSTGSVVRGPTPARRCGNGLDRVSTRKFVSSGRAGERNNHFSSSTAAARRSSISSSTCRSDGVGQGARGAHWGTGSCCSMAGSSPWRSTPVADHEEGMRLILREPARAAQPFLDDRPRSPPSDIAWCTAAKLSPARCSSTNQSWHRSRSVPTWRRCTIPPTWPASAPRCTRY